MLVVTGHESPACTVCRTLYVTVPDWPLSVPFPVRTPAQASLTVLVLTVVLFPLGPVDSVHWLSMWIPEPELLSTVFEVAVL